MWDKRWLEPNFPFSWAKFWRIVLQEVAGTAGGIIGIDDLAGTLPVAGATTWTTMRTSPAATLTTVIVGIAVLVVDGVHVMSTMSTMARVSTMASMPLAASGTTLSAALRTSFVLMQQAVVDFVTASTAGDCQHRNEGPNDVFHGR
jgi:hypothetical protein